MSYQNCIRSDTIAVNGTPAFFESEDYIHGGDGLSLSVLAVHCGVLDDSAEEVVDEVPGFIVDGAAVPFATYQMIYPQWGSELLSDNFFHYLTNANAQPIAQYHDQGESTDIKSRQTSEDNENFYVSLAFHAALVWRSDPWEGFCLKSLPVLT